jgi:hypothetical protein
MSVASALVRGNLTNTNSERAATNTDPSRVAQVACAAVATLVIVAPFEALTPLLRLPGQSLTTVETVLVGAFVACGVAALRERRGWWQIRGADALPCVLFIILAFTSALLAPEFNANAVHMAARLTLGAIVAALTVAGSRSEVGRRRIGIACVSGGAIVAVLVVADFLGLPGVSRFLSLFRTSIAVVGTQVRSAGPFQYPTIASMYLEIAFALGLGLLVAAEWAGVRTYVAVIAALALIVEGIVLTFTRAGLLTAALSIALVGARHVRNRGLDRGTIALAILVVIAAAELLSSRSVEVLMLRLTTEGQGRWYSAIIQAPTHVALDTREPAEVPITVTNTGRATWDSDAAEPVRLSYHWIAEDSDDVVAWEGTRTRFDEPVRPGQTVSVVASVGAPGRPGRFRLMWDIEQEHRLWFSTEPDAVIAFTRGIVTGPMTSVGSTSGPLRVPRMSVRPGRLLLWGAALRMVLARPLLGVGPDNYRLLYGRYSTLKAADPRVHSNNMFVELIAGTGVAGACALAWVGWRVARSALLALRTPGLAIGVVAACAAIAVHGLVDSFLSFTGTYIPIAAAAGLLFACAQDGEGDAHRV